MAAPVLTKGINTLAYPIEGIEIDGERMRADFNHTVGSVSWQDRNRYQNKGWKGVALYSKTGSESDLSVNYVLPAPRTPIGELCPYICEEVLPQFKAPWLRAGFYKLEAGATIGEHRDLVHHAFTRTMVRIHIPVITDPQVLMYVGRRPYHFASGTAWYFDPTALHAVKNRSRIDRIHLIVDFEYGPGLETFLLRPTRSDNLRFTWISCRYYVNRAIKPVYSRARRLLRRGPKRPQIA